MASKKAVVLTDRNFDKKITTCTKPAVVIFTSDVTSHWKGMDQTLQVAIEARFKGKFSYFTVDYAAEKGLRKKYNTPLLTVIIFNGNQEIGRLIGPQDLDDLSEKINGMLYAASLLAA